METADRHVALTELKFCRISTVFLGLDNSFRDRGPPILFETMVFHKTEGVTHWKDAGEAFEQCRYANWEDAELGHRAMVKRMLELEAAALMPDASGATRET
jgi:hypothetical protein